MWILLFLAFLTPGTVSVQVIETYHEESAEADCLLDRDLIRQDQLTKHSTLNEQQATLFACVKLKEPEKEL